MLNLKNWLAQLEPRRDRGDDRDLVSPQVTSGLTIAQYRELVQDLPRPTLQQMDSFARFVCKAHSWYKHLPMFAPGRPFVFFIDPVAGMQLTIDKNGRASALERMETGFHYSWIPTAQYRQRFGHLALSRSAGTVVALHRADGTRTVGADDEAVVFDPITGVSNGLPPEVIDAGTAWVSGIVHASATGYLSWTLGSKDPPAIAWPEESGGSAAFDAIVRRCRQLRADPTVSEQAPREALMEDANFCWADWKLQQLLEPERCRQRTGMISAMQRVARICWGG